MLQVCSSGKIMQHSFFSKSLDMWNALPNSTVSVCNIYINISDTNGVYHAF